MQQTYKMFNALRQPEFSKLTNEQLAAAYKETQNQAILAEMFCKNIKWWQSIITHSLFNPIEKTDKVSYCVERIHSAMLTYNGSTKFITYATRVIQIKLYQQLEHLSYCGRGEVVLSLEGLAEAANSNSSRKELFEGNFDAPQKDLFKAAEIKYDLEQTNLTEKEKAVCVEILYDSKISNTDIAAHIGVHRHTVEHIKKSLQVKLSYLKR